MSTINSRLPSEQPFPESLERCCPRCKCNLALHQPDPHIPERLLATCGECSWWFLMNSDGTVLMPIPPLAEEVERSRDGENHRSQKSTA
jgi:hypothetical protein